MSKCVYAGSFDPFTLGHMQIVDEAAKIFDEVVIAVAQNANKKNWISAEDRCWLINRLYARSRSSVTAYVCDSLLVDFMDENECEYCVRGIRNTTDMAVEHNLADINFELGNKKTIFLLAPPEVRNVSSSLVRELYSHKKDISRLVPESIYDWIKLRNLG